jgi:serine/threonine protein phosphatase PrpC
LLFLSYGTGWDSLLALYAWVVPCGIEYLLRVECFAATKPQRGRTENEDAYLISLGDPAFAVLCDGGGKPERSAKKALTLFQRLCRESTSHSIAEGATWAAWIKTLDSALLEGAPSTFLGVVFLDALAVGACVGDSRAYLVNRDGDSQVLTEKSSKYRLGSCNASPLLIRQPMKRGDALLLMTDGAWTPLTHDSLKLAFTEAVARHFSEVPKAILELASQCGQSDDMTIIAIRVAP